MLPAPPYDAYAIGFVSIDSLQDGDWSSLRSQDCTNIASAAGAACPSGLSVLGISLIITGGTVHYRFTGETDVGAAGDAHATYPGAAASLSIPVKGVRDLSASPSEELTRVSLHPISATGTLLAYFGAKPRT